MSVQFDGRRDTYHVQFQILADELKVERDEGTPFELTVAVVFMVKCPDDQQLRPSSIIGKVNLPLIQCFREEVSPRQGQPASNPMLPGRGFST
jgi:hypothetical protein